MSARVHTNDAPVRPIEGAEVTAWLDVAGARRAVGQGFTSGEGIADIDLADLRSMPRRHVWTAWLFVYVMAPGYVQRLAKPVRVQDLLGDSTRPSGWSVEVSMVSGSAMRGRALDFEGRPMADVVVSLHEWDAGRVDSPGSEATTDPLGRFAVRIPKAGNYYVAAVPRGYEVRRSDPVPVSGTRDVRVPDLIFTETEKTPGTIRYADGTPVADLRFAMDANYLDLDTDLAGRPPIAARTDSIGRFEVMLDSRGILPILCNYRVVIPGILSHLTGFDPRLDRQTLVLDKHRLRIRLEDQAGRPLECQPVRFDHTVGIGARPIEGVTDNEGEVSIFVEHGVRGTLTVLGPANAALSRTVTIPASGNEQRIEIRVPEPEPEGWVELSVRHPTGRHAYPSRALVYDEDGIELASVELERDHVRLPLPPGVYAIHVRLSARGLHEKGLLEPSTALGVDGRVVVQARETTELGIVVRGSAGLAIRLDSEASRGDLVPNCAVWLRHPSGLRERVNIWTLDQGGRVRPGCWFGQWGTASELREPGVYSIAVEAAGFLPATQEVRLAKGDIARVTLLLKSK